MDKLKLKNEVHHRRSKKVPRFLFSDQSYEEQDKWGKVCDDFVVLFFFMDAPLASLELDELITRQWRAIFLPEDESACPTALQIRAVSTAF